MLPSVLPLSTIRISCGRPSYFTAPIRAGRDSSSRCFPSQLTMMIVVVVEATLCVSVSLCLLKHRGTETQRQKATAKSNGSSRRRYGKVRSFDLIEDMPPMHLANASFDSASVPSTAHFQERNT